MSEPLSWEDWHKKKPVLICKPHPEPTFVPLFNIRTWMCPSCHRLVGEHHPCPAHNGADVVLATIKGEVTVDGASTPISGVREV